MSEGLHRNVPRPIGADDPVRAKLVGPAALRDRGGAVIDGYKIGFDAGRKAGDAARSSLAPDPNCEACKGTGWYGDNGPGIRGNREYHRCDQCGQGKADALRREGGEGG